LETQVAASSAVADPLGQWILNTSRQTAEWLQDATSIDLYVGQQEYRYKPRLIRQSSDTWGNAATSARYESDVAWFLIEAIRNRSRATPGARISPPATRPHLEQVGEHLEGCLEEVRDGTTECELLNDLRFLSDVTQTQALIGSTPGPVVQPGNLDAVQQAALRLLTVGSFLLNGVSVIDVRAPDEDYAFALFEPLNTTGQLLTALETLKPLVVLAEGGTSTYAASPSDVSFTHVEKYFAPELGAQEKAKRISEWLTAFALAETGARLARNLLDQRQYLRSQFQALGSAGTPSGLMEQRGFVRHLADSATFMFDVWRDPDAAFLASASQFDRLCIELLRSTNHVIVLPLLERYYAQWVASKTGANKRRVLEALRAVTVFWALWRTSRATTKGIDDTYRKLMSLGAPGPASLSALARRPSGGPPSSGLPSASELRATLRATLHARGHIAGKADWVIEVNNQALYETSKQLAKFVLLAAHHDSIDDPGVGGLIAAGVAGAAPCLDLGAWAAHNSVEHVAPQTPARRDRSYEKAIFEQGLVSRLGNLTLLPQDLNSLLGNKSWPFKAGVYGILSDPTPQGRVSRLQSSLPGLAQTTKDVLLASNYMPFCNALSKHASPSLTAAFVTQRGERLAELAWDELWPYLS
jgi:hypothetical protein